MDQAERITRPRHRRTRGRLGVLVAVLLVTAGLGGPLLVATGLGTATPEHAPTNESSATPGTRPAPTPHQPARAPPVSATNTSDDPPDPPDLVSRKDHDDNESRNASTYDECAGKGFVWGGICNVIEDSKRSIVGGALETTGAFVDVLLAMLVRRPVPSRGGEIAILRPPTNEPMAGAFRGWQSRGLPLGFLVWVIGVGVALASRFRPDASFATTGFRIEENLVRNFVLVLGSWWLGAFVLHLANAMIRAAAPTASQFGMSVQTSLGSLLAAGVLVWFFYVAAGTVAVVLLVTTILSYLAAITLMVFLPVFSGLLLFESNGVLGTFGWFGQKGWDVFIRTALFPFPAAFVLGGGTYLAGGLIPVVEEAIAIGGLAELAGMFAYAILMFAVLVLALLASLWMVLGGGGAGMAVGVLAGLGGATLYNRAKGKVAEFSRETTIPSFGSDASSGSATGSPGWSPGSPGPGSQWGGALGPGASTDAAGPLAAGSSGTSAGGGGLARMEVPTGGRPPATAAMSDDPSGDVASAGTGLRSDAGMESGVSGRRGAQSEPIVVTGERDLPGSQDYTPGYVSDEEFQPIEVRGFNREFLVRQHDRFTGIFDSEGDHAGIYLRGETDDRLYDASAVAGEDWGLSVNEEAAMSREAVYDARKAGGGQQ